jgi:hypothetical protein
LHHDKNFTQLITLITEPDIWDASTFFSPAISFLLNWKIYLAVQNLPAHALHQSSDRGEKSIDQGCPANERVSTTIACTISEEGCKKRITKRFPTKTLVCVEKRIATDCKEESRSKTQTKPAKR